MSLVKFPLMTARPTIAAARLLSGSSVACPPVKLCLVVAQVVITADVFGYHQEGVQQHLDVAFANQGFHESPMSTTSIQTPLSPPVLNVPATADGPLQSAPGPDSSSTPVATTGPVTAAPESPAPAESVALSEQAGPVEESHNAVGVAAGLASTDTPRTSVPEVLAEQRPVSGAYTTLVYDTWSSLCLLLGKTANKYTYRYSIADNKSYNHTSWAQSLLCVAIE